MATESKANKNATATCIVQVVRLISIELLKLATHETLNTDWWSHVYTACGRPQFSIALILPHLDVLKCFI